MWKADQPDLQSANMGPKGPQSARSGGGESKCTLQAYKDSLAGVGSQSGDSAAGENSFSPIIQWIII